MDGFSPLINSMLRLERVVAKVSVSYQKSVEDNISAIKKSHRLSTTSMTSAIGLPS